MIIHNPILTGSFTVNGTDVASITSSAASITAINAYTASQDILNGTYTLTSSFAAQTASFTAFTSSVNTFTASQLVLNGTYATTGSNTFAGIQTVNSNLVVTGSITAQTLVVQTITSSVDFVTGSTRFGSSLSTSTHQFTGSVSITGSLAVVTNGTEFQVTSTGVNLGNVIGDAHNITGSVGISGSLSGTSANFNSTLTAAGATINGNATISVNQNSLTRLVISNTTAGTGAYVETSFTSDSSAGSGAVGKFSSTSTTYKITTASNTYLYNGSTAGDIAILNDFASGSIKMAAGGSSTSHFTIASNGAATISANDTSGTRINPFNTLTITTDNPNLPYGFFGGSILFRNRSYTSGVVDSARIRSVIYDDGAPNNFGGGLWFETTPTPGGALTSSLVINYQGRVGIGTTSPVTNLEVVGSLGATGLRYSSSPAKQGVYLGNSSATPGTTAYATIEMCGGATGGCEIDFTKPGFDFRGRIGYDISTDYMWFVTAGTERMRIISTGQVQIKQADDSHSGGFSLINAAVGSSWNFVNGGDNNLYFGYQGVSKGVFNTAGVYTALSDINKKKDFEESTIGLSAILGLKPTLYRMEEEDESAEKQLGFIAQEVKEFIPQAYIEKIDGERTFIGLQDRPIISALVKAIQELKAEIEILKNK